MQRKDYKMMKIGIFLFVFATLFSTPSAKVTPAASSTPPGAVIQASSDTTEGCAVSFAAQEGISIEEATKKLDELMNATHSSK